MAASPISILSPGSGGRLRHIGIAGNMGVGKSTLSGFLGADLDAEVAYEDFGENPYLARYYGDRRRFALGSQLFFLSQAFRQHLDIQASGSLTIQDRTVHEHFQVFVKALHAQGALDDDDYALIAGLYRSIARAIAPLDALIFLAARPETLLARIAHRARAMEREVDAAYLGTMDERYRVWVADTAQEGTARVIRVATDDIDVREPRQRERLIAGLREALA